MSLERRTLLHGGVAALLAGCAGTRPDRGPKLGFTAIAAEGAGDALRLPPGYAARALEGAGTAPGALAYAALDNSRRGLLAIAAQGVALLEVAESRGEWSLMRPSRLARRISAETPCSMAGPAAGHQLLRTAADLSGRSVVGTLASGCATATPWGTVLVGETRWAEAFDGGDYLTADQRRFDLRPRGSADGAAAERRFDARRHPNEFHRFGWVLEINPADPASPPVKRSALGRGAHGALALTTARDGRVILYTSDAGEQEAIYRFVSRDAAKPGGPQANNTLLDEGTLQVARFEPDGSGRWLPLLQGQGGLLPARGFADMAETLIKRRQAADILGATRLGRPGGVAVAAGSGEVFCMLGNDALGRVLRWTEEGGANGLAFRWKAILPAGEPSAPEALAADGRGLLWLQGDSLRAAEPAASEWRRFLGAAVAGLAWTPDGRTLFASLRPDGGGHQRPPLVAVRRTDGGAIGS